MKCTAVDLGNGTRAIVCTSERNPRCNCGRPGKLRCDWKFKADGRTRFERGTCSRAVCDRCTTSPAEGKDLCQRHAAEWKARSAQR